jgi:hypothetical protein
MYINKNCSILIIEPRNQYIDIVKKYIADTKPSNVKLVTKALLSTNKTTDAMLLYDDKYSIQTPDLYINGSNINTKKQSVYTTSLPNIITEHQIQNIQEIVFNINIDNCNLILDSLKPFNHIVSYIKFHPDVSFEQNNSLLSDFFNQKELYTYEHKNLHIELPKIGIYFIEPIDAKSSKKASLFIHQYKMNVIHKDNLIEYPNSVDVVINKPEKQSKIFHEVIIQQLDQIFEKEIHKEVNKDVTVTRIEWVDKFSSSLDLVIQFNPKYLHHNNAIQIMYPLKDNIIYVNKQFDVMYATRHCMFILYQILNSDYFAEYITLKQTEKSSLFKLFSKRYFYEYISNIFVVKEF